MFDNLGKALRLVRELRRKSQGQVARAAGIGKSQMSKYEGGRELPKLDTLTKVCKALEVGPFEVFYMMHLIDMEAANLDVAQVCREKGFPPLTLAGRGLLSDEQDAAFHRLLNDVMTLYGAVFVNKLKDAPEKQ